VRPKLAPLLDVEALVGSVKVAGEAELRRLERGRLDLPLGLATGAHRSPPASAPRL
jgi:hypothetical protein